MAEPIGMHVFCLGCACVVNAVENFGVVYIKRIEGMLFASRSSLRLVLCVMGTAYHFG